MARCGHRLRRAASRIIVAVTRPLAVVVVVPVPVVIAATLAVSVTVLLLLGNIASHHGLNRCSVVCIVVSLCRTAICMQISLLISVQSTLNMLVNSSEVIVNRLSLKIYKNISVYLK